MAGRTRSMRRAALRKLENHEVVPGAREAMAGAAGAMFGWLNARAEECLRLALDVYEVEPRRCLITHEQGTSVWTFSVPEGPPPTGRKPVLEWGWEQPRLDNDNCSAEHDAYVLRSYVKFLDEAAIPDVPF